MAELLDQNASYKQIKYIIHYARKFVVIISPFVDFESLYELINDRRSKDVFLQVFAYKNKSDDSKDDIVIDELKKLHNVSLNVFHRPDGRYDKRFHCKCYFNESRFMISSMNLSWAKNRLPNFNFEYSVLLYKLKDKKLYFEAIDWFCSCFVRKIVGYRLGMTDLFNHVSLGHCTSCGVSIVCNLQRHYCTDCYSKEIKYTSVRILKYCHYCGGSMDGISSIMHRDCYDQYYQSIGINKRTFI